MGRHETKTSAGSWAPSVCYQLATSCLQGVRHWMNQEVEFGRNNRGFRSLTVHPSNISDEYFLRTCRSFTGRTYRKKEHKMSPSWRLTQLVQSGEEAYLTLPVMDPLAGLLYTPLAHVPQASGPIHCHIITRRTLSLTIVEALLKNHISEEYQITQDQMEVL